MKQVGDLNQWILESYLQLEAWLKATVEEGDRVLQQQLKREAPLGDD